MEPRRKYLFVTSGAHASLLFCLFSKHFLTRNSQWNCEMIKTHCGGMHRTKFTITYRVNPECVLWLKRRTPRAILNNVYISVASRLSCFSVCPPEWRRLPVCVPPGCMSHYTAWQVQSPVGWRCWILHLAEHIQHIRGVTNPFLTARTFQGVSVPVNNTSSGFHTSELMCVLHTDEAAPRTGVCDFAGGGGKENGIRESL